MYRRGPRQQHTEGSHCFPLKHVCFACLSVFMITCGPAEAFTHPERFACVKPWSSLHFPAHKAGVTEQQAHLLSLRLKCVTI